MANIFPHVSSKSVKYNELCGKGLKFLQLNVVSILKYYDEIKAILCENVIHVFALNETRLDDNIFECEIQIPHYNVIRKDRNRNDGGVLTYIHESLGSEVLKHSSLLRMESIALLIRQKNASPIVFLNWYRPPNSKAEILTDYEDFLVYANGLN